MSLCSVMALLSKFAVAAVSGQSEPLVPEALHNIGRQNRKQTVCHARCCARSLVTHPCGSTAWPRTSSPRGCSQGGRAHCPQAAEWPGAHARSLPGPSPRCSSVGWGRRCGTVNGNANSRCIAVKFPVPLFKWTYFPFDATVRMRERVVPSWPLYRCHHVIFCPSASACRLQKYQPSACVCQSGLAARFALGFTSAFLSVLLCAAL